MWLSNRVALFTMCKWTLEQSFPDRVNGRTGFFDRWYWVSDTIKDAHVNLNIHRKWYFEEKNPLSSNWDWPKKVDRDKTDYLTVAVHELGHAIGLVHVLDSSNIMYPCTGTGKRVYPDYKDIEKFFKNHDYEIKNNALPFLMGAK